MHRPKTNTTSDGGDIKTDDPKLLEELGLKDQLKGWRNYREILGENSGAEGTVADIGIIKFGPAEETRIGTAQTCWKVVEFQVVTERGGMRK